MKCENFFKKGSPLCVIIAPNQLLKCALIEVLITFETFKMDCHIIQKPLKGCYISFVLFITLIMTCSLFSLASQLLYFDNAWV